jgi:hypothetical protein
MRRHPFLAAVLALTFLGAFQIGPSGAATPPDLTLSNSLNSNYAVMHSLVGPPLGFYKDSDCQDPHCGGPGIDVKAPPEYVPGATVETRRGVGIGGGPYCCLQRLHLIVLRDPSRVINADQGRITVWYRQVADPVPFESGVYRIFGGPYGHGENITLWTDADPTPGRLHFQVGQLGRHDNPDATEAMNLRTGNRGVDISGFNGQWILIKAVWNRSGLGVTGQTVQLFINDKKVAAGFGSAWSSDLGPTVDIAGGNDEDIAGKFFIDSLKLYSTSG